MSAKALNHAEVQETADRVAKQFKELDDGGSHWNLKISMKRMI